MNVVSKLFVLLCALGLFLQVYPAVTATISGSPKPALGDWDISDATVLADETVEFGGNIVVKSGGSLTLDNAVLKFKCASDGEYGLTIKSGGALTVTGGSHITRCGSSNYVLICEAGADFSMDGSKIEYCGYDIGETYDDVQGWKLSGPYFACDGTITDSVIDNCLQGIVCEDNTFTVKDSTIQNSLWHNVEGRNTKNFVVDNCVCLNSVEKCNVEFYAGSTGALKNSVVTGAGHNAVWMMTDNTVTIENNDISGAPYNGIWAADNCKLTIKNNKVYDNDCSGMWFEQGCDVTATGNTIIDNGDTESATFKQEDEAGMRPGHGFAAFDSTVVFNDNTVGSNWGHNFETTNCTTTFNDNDFSASRAKCNVEFYEGSVVTAKRNVIDGAGHNCFWIRDNVKATIEDNTLLNSPHNGIWAGIGCELTIRNNKISKCAESGIYAFNCTLVIENNEITDCGWYGIQTEGGSLTKSGNTVATCTKGGEYRGLWTTCTALDEGGAALTDAEVTITDGDDAVVWTGKTRTDGSTDAFLLDQVGGPYTMKAEWGDVSAKEDFEPDGTTTSLSLTLKEEESSSSTAMIIGVVVIMIVILVIAGLVVFLVIKKKPEDEEETEDNSGKRGKGGGRGRKGGKD